MQIDFWEVSNADRMKHCACCGRENDDAAMRCRECGTEFKVSTSTDTIAETPKPRFDFKPLAAEDIERDLVTLVTCRRLWEADMVVSRLEAAGIISFIPDQFLMQAICWNLNTYGYVRVQVSPNDYDAAREILSAVSLDA